MTSVFANSFSSAMRTATFLNKEDRNQLTDALMILLVQALCGRLNDETERPDDTHAIQFTPISAYIDAHLTDDGLSIARLCEIFAITPKMLNRLFQKSVGESPMRMVQRKRLECAAADLKDPVKSGFSITQIAMLYGFCDASHFSRRFKHHFGESPRMIRDTIHNHDGELSR